MVKRLHLVLSLSGICFLACLSIARAQVDVMSLKGNPEFTMPRIDGKWRWLAEGEPWRTMPSRNRTASAGPATLTQVNIEQDGASAATTITGGQSVKVKAQGLPGLSNVKALLYNDTHTAPAGASSQSLLGTVVNLNAAGVVGTVGHYEAVLPLSSLLDAGGQTAQSVRGAVRHLKKKEVTVAYGRTNPGTLIYSPNPTVPTALVDDFGSGISEQRWTEQGPAGTAPTASGGRVEFPLASATETAILRTTHLDYQAVSAGSIEVQATVGTNANPGGAGHGEVANFVLYVNNGTTNLEGYSFVFQSDGNTVSMAAGANTDLDGNAGGTVFTALGVTFPANSGLPVKIIVDQIALEARFYTWDGAQFVLRHTVPGLPNIARSNMGLLMNANRHTTVAAPYVTFWLDDLSTTIRRPPQSHLMSLTPLALDGVPYDSLSPLGNNNSGAFVIRPDLEGQFDFIDQAAGGYVFITPSTDLNAALVTFTPNVGDPIRMTLYSFYGEAHQTADLATPPPGFSSITVDRWVDKVFTAGASSTADFTWSAADFAGGDSSDPPAPVGINPELSFNGGQYQLRASGYNWNGKLYDGTGGGYPAGTEAIFVESLAPLTATAITTAFANVGGLTGNEPVNMVLLSMGPNGGNGYALGFTTLAQADIATLLPVGGAVDKFFAGTLAPNGPGQNYTYNPPPAGDLITRFFDTPAEVMTSVNALTVPPPDTTLPTVNLTAPTAAQVFGVGNITVTATMSDNVGIATGQVVLKLDGNDITAQAVVSATAVSATLAGLTEGNHTLSLDAKDSSGNSAVQASVTFTVDLTGPVLAVTQPVGGSTLSASTVVVSGTAGDAATVTVNGLAATLNGGNFSLQTALVEGANTLTVVATDAAGNINQQQVEVTRDSTGPVLTVAQPVGGSTLSVGYDFVVSGTAGDAVSVRINGQAVVLNGGNFSTTLGLVLGLNTVTVVGADSLGNTTQQRVTVTRDNTPPALVLTSPQEGANFQTGTLVQVTGTTVAGATVSLNGNPITLNGTAFSGQHTVVQGANLLTVRSVDSLGLEAQQAITIQGTAGQVVDTVAPVVAFTNPAEGSFQGGSVTVLASLSDNIGVAVASVVVFLDGVVVTAQAQITAGGVSLALTGLAAGQHLVRIETSDAAGNRTEVQRSFRVDLSAPQITLSSPTTTILNTPAAILSIAGTVSDEQGVASLTLGGVALTLLAGGGFSTQVPLSEGLNTFTLIATDTGGLASTLVLTVTRFVPDTTPPRLVITRPATASVYVNQSPLLVEGETEPGAILTADEVPVLVGPDGRFTYSMMLSEGVNSVLFVAADAAGNEAEAMQEVVLDLNGPVLGWQHPTQEGITDWVSPLLVQVREPTGSNGSGIDRNSVSLMVNGTPVPLVMEGVNNYRAASKLDQTLQHILTLSARDLAGNTSTSVVKLEPFGGTPQLSLENQSRQGAKDIKPGERLKVSLSGELPSAEKRPFLLVNGEKTIPSRWGVVGEGGTLAYDSVLGKHTAIFTFSDQHFADFEGDVVYSLTAIIGNGGLRTVTSLNDAVKAETVPGLISSEPLEVKVDTTTFLGRWVVVESPAKGALLAGSSRTIRGAFDQTPLKVTRVKAFVNGKTSLGTPTQFLAGKQAGEFEFSLNTLDLVDGKHSLTIVLTCNPSCDTNNQSTVEFEVDNTSPDVRLKDGP